MSLYIKKPVIIEATQWFKNGDHPLDHDPIGYERPTSTDLDRYYEYKQTEGKIVRYYRHPNAPENCEQCRKPHHVHGWIDTLEQGHRVCPGDWIITGVKGERYPCKPDVFEATYTAVTAAEDVCHSPVCADRCRYPSCMGPAPDATAPASAQGYDKLLTIIAYTYQIAGAHYASAHILDVLADPEAATMEQVEAMLPYVPASAHGVEWRNLQATVQMVCNMLERDSQPVRKEAADELHKAMDAIVSATNKD